MKKRDSSKKISKGFFVTTIECKGCQKGVEMCKRNPCLPTPEEVLDLISRGYAKSLAMDYYTTYDDIMVKTISIAMKGREGQRNNSYGERCLLINNECSIHSFKPRGGGYGLLQEKQSCKSLGHSGNLDNQRRTRHIQNGM